MDIPRGTLLLMYERMLKIRHFEDRVKDLFAAGEMPGFVHLYLPGSSRRRGMRPA